MAATLPLLPLQAETDAGRLPHVRYANVRTFIHFERSGAGANRTGFLPDDAALLAGWWTKPRGQVLVVQFSLELAALARSLLGVGRAGGRRDVVEAGEPLVDGMVGAVRGGSDEPVAWVGHAADRAPLPELGELHALAASRQAGQLDEVRDRQRAVNEKQAQGVGCYVECLSPDGRVSGELPDIGTFGATTR